MKYLKDMGANVGVLAQHLKLQCNCYESKQSQIFNSGRALTPVDISMQTSPTFDLTIPISITSLVLYPCQNLRHLKTIQDKES